MRGSMSLLLTGILMTTMLVGCSSQSDVSGGNSSRNAMEKQAISIYEALLKEMDLQTALKI